jgi:hypothetical protein
VTAAPDASEADHEDQSEAEQRERPVALSSSSSAAARLFDKRLLLAQPIDGRAVVEMASAW